MSIVRIKQRLLRSKSMFSYYNRLPLKIYKFNEFQNIGTLIDIFIKNCVSLLVLLGVILAVNQEPMLTNLTPQDLF